MAKPAASISIIISTLNAANHLGRCLESIRNQIVEAQLIIIDGGSTDGTIGIIRAYEKMIHYWISERDTGIYDAWNKGIRQVTREWVYFLGSDDWFYSEAVLKNVNDILKGLPEKQLVAYGKICLLSQLGTERTVGEDWAKIEKRFRFQMCIPHQAVFHRLALFNNLGYFDSSFRVAGDYAILIRHLLNSPPYFMSQIIVSFMAMGGVSTQSKHAFRVLLEFGRASYPYWNLESALWWFGAFLRSCIKSMFFWIVPEKVVLKIRSRLQG